MATFTDFWSCTSGLIWLKTKENTCRSGNCEPWHLKIRESITKAGRHLWKSPSTATHVQSSVSSIKLPRAMSSQILKYTLGTETSPTLWATYFIVHTLTVNKFILCFYFFLSLSGILYISESTQWASLKKALSVSL